MRLDFFVRAPKGEARSRPAWWAAIANESQKQMLQNNLICTRDPVRVEVEFVLPCPMGKRYTADHVTAPGLPSLILALSGMEKIIIDREEQIVELNVRKRYNGEYSAGANISVVSV